MIVLFAIAFLTILIYYLTTKNFSYWSKRKVPYPKPIPLFGNYREYILLKKHVGKVAQEICQQFPKEPYVGVYYGTSPALLIKDPNIIKLVMSKDFYYFDHREVSDYIHKEFLTQNMFFSGGDTWRVLRQNLTSLFSSSKIKNMFSLIENCALNLDKAISNELKKDNTVEVKSLSVRYTMDCIGSSTFGVNTATLENAKDNPFTILGHKLFDSSNYSGFKQVTRAMWPSIFYKLGFHLFNDDVNTFFMDLLSKVFKDRNYKESTKNDFVDLLLSWKKKNYLSGDSIDNLKTDSTKIKERKTVQLKVDDVLLIGHCSMLFAAGFETTSTTISHLLFELAKHNEIQNRLIDEVDDYYERFEGKLNFECINETPYLQACLEETLRLYPVIGNITREVREDYVLPTGLRLEKGMRIHLPLFYLHHNEEYFPEPQKFRPERFLGEEKKNIKQYTYMPFGEGHRICIGLRFSKMPMTAAILTILKKYRVELADNMPKTLTFEPRTFVTQPVGGINLNLISRK